MDRLREMEVFVCIVERGSLSRAADSLGVSLPTVVRLLAGLEKRLGARLLQRTTRRISLTHEGGEYYERSKRILLDVDEAEGCTVAAAPQGVLRVTAPVLFGQLHVQPLVLDFLRRYPAVSVDLLMLDRPVDLLEERIDVAVRIGILADSSLVAHRVADVGLVLCASPEYLAGRGTPGHPQELRHHACLRFSGFNRPVEWKFTVGGKELTVPVSGPLSANHNATLIDGCLQGLGIARFYYYQVAPLVAAGKLRIVLREYFEPKPVNVVVPSTRHLPARTRLLAERLRSELPARLGACRN